MAGILDLDQPRAACPADGGAVGLAHGAHEHVDIEARPPAVVALLEQERARPAAYECWVRFRVRLEMSLETQSLADAEAAVLKPLAAGLMRLPRQAGHSIWPFQPPGPVVRIAFSWPLGSNSGV